jgi:hypothetical protein
MASAELSLPESYQTGFFSTPHSSSFRTALFTISWLLIFLAASYDAYFAWQYREVLNAWELNPIILWLASVGGIASVFAIKFLSMAFSASVAIACHRRRHRLEIPLTLAVGSIYFVLSFHYLMSYAKG